MKALDELIQHYEDKMCQNGNTQEALNLYTNTFGDLLTLQQMLEVREFEYKDTIRMLVSFVEERDYDPFNFYHTDILSEAKRLSIDM